MGGEFDSEVGEPLKSIFRYELREKKPIFVVNPRPPQLYHLVDDSDRSCLAILLVHYNTYNHR